MRVITRAFVLLLLGASLALAKSPETPTTSELEWRFGIVQNLVAKSTITVANRCFTKHRMKLELEDLPFVRFLDNPIFQVNPRSQRVVPVEIDSRGLDAGLHHGIVWIICTDCREEPGCTQDRDRLHVYMTVVVRRPNWSNIHPEQKDPANQSPRLRWSGIAPERKPVRAE